MTTQTSNEEKIFDLAHYLLVNPEAQMRLIKALINKDANMVLQVARAKGMTMEIIKITFPHTTVEFEVTRVQHDKVTRLIAIEGKKVDAIKELRSITGMGLKEAKDTVEAWEANYHLTK